MTTFRNGAYIPGTTQNFTTSGSSQFSVAVGANTSIVRVAVNQDTYVVIGSANPVATVNSMFIPAGKVEFFATTPGVTQVAFLQVSAAGKISITELI